jgi:integrase
MTIRSRLERYVNMRQGLGYKYREQARRLFDFVSYMEARKATTITTKLALAWATLPPRSHVSSARRLTDVRGFARHVASIDPKTEVPPTGIFPQWRRPKPYVYTDGEIDALLGAALALPPTDGLRRWIYHHLFGLIAVTGMRLSEAIGLQRGDVDLKEGMLAVQQTKFGKSRLLPLHPTTRAALRSYAERRDAHLGSRCGSHFFVAERGGRLVPQYVHSVFWRLSREIGLRRPGPDRACTTSGIGSPSARSSVGIATGWTSRRSFRRCQPISATPMCGTPIGTCRPVPNCCRRRRAASMGDGRPNHEGELQCRRAHRALLHRSAHAPAQCQR